MEMAGLVKMAEQRACAMGLLGSILLNQNLETVEMVRNQIVGGFAEMITSGAVVGDSIDLEIAKLCKNYLEQTQAVKEAEGIVAGKAGN